MTRTEKHVVPLLLLATGSLGTGADATIITQDLSSQQGPFLDITSTAASLAATPGDDTKYRVITPLSNPKGGGGGYKKGTTHDDTTGSTMLGHYDSDVGGFAGMTAFSTNAAIGTASDNYAYGTEFIIPHDVVDYYHPLVTRYTQLKFSLDGVTTYGVATAYGSHIDAISYEVLDAVAPVPEPAIWAQMIAGFGAVGAVIRRRRRSTRATAA